MTSTSRRGAGLLLALVAIGGSAAAQPTIGDRPQSIDDRFVPTPPGIAVSSWIEGLEAPWSLVFLPDGRALVSERPGRIRVIEGGRLRAQPYAAIDVAEGGEGGLMGLAAHPDFPRAPFVYAMHTQGGTFSRSNRVVRLRDDGRGLVLDRVIVEGIPGASNHNGGRIAFGPDGMLHVGTGDTYRAELAQDRASLGGKILRVTPEGAVPADNPFPRSPIYSLGHRNVQGLAWHPQTRALFASEHGPSGEFGLRALDEINAIVPGASYGWPRAVGAPGRRDHRDPVVAWPDPTTPPSGIAFWRGDLFVATLRSQALIRIRLAGDAGVWRATLIERWFAQSGGSGRYGRLRDAVVGPDGALYVLTNNRDGRGRPQPGDDRILRIMSQP